MSNPRLINRRGSYLLVAVIVAAMMLLAVVSVALAAENSIRLITSGTGTLRVTTISVGMFETGVGTADIIVPGTPTTATITWTGRGVAGDDTITVDITDKDGNSTGAKNYTAVDSEEAYANFDVDGVPWNVYVYIAELPVAAFSTLTNTVTISGVDITENQGATVAVTSFSSTFEKRLISRYWGLDSFHSNWTGLYGPYSQLICQEFDAANNDRDLRFNLYAGGVEIEPRPNSIWYQVGSGPVPTADIVGVGVEISEANDGSGNYPFYATENDNGEGQYAAFKESILIPATSTWVCFQMESYNDGPLLGTSALWHGLVTSLSLPPDPPTAVTLSSFSAIGNELLGPVLMLLVVAGAGITGLFILFSRRLAKNFAEVEANSK